MKKAFTHYFLPICVLLLGGFINLYADSQYDFGDENACCVEYHQGRHQTSSIGSQHSEAEKKHCIETEIEEKEEKDEEAPSHSLDERHGSYLTAFFYAPIGEHYNSEFGTGLAQFHPDFKTTALKRHIRFQVFRI